nr:2-oxo-hepta-3-ene-1,7-dioic acid hydratase [Sphingomonas sp. CDS-1]
MVMDAATIEDAAARLLEAERTGIQIGLLSIANPGMDMDDAYAIQGHLVRRKVAAGDPVIGWKIGLTSRAMQQALNIDIPDSGVLLQSMLFENGAAVPPGRFIQPRIEAEIAFVMKDALSSAATVDEVIAATDYIVPAIEILDTRIQRHDPNSGIMRTVFDTISDNAANAGIVMGQPCRDFRDLDLRWIGAIVSRDGHIEATGLGAGVLDSPALSVSWLAERLGHYDDAIEPGQVVLSGSFIAPVECPTGSRIEADFGPLGTVTCQFG